MASKLLVSKTRETFPFLIFIDFSMKIKIKLENYELISHLLCEYSRAEQEHLILYTFLLL